MDRRFLRGNPLILETTTQTNWMASSLMCRYLLFATLCTCISFSVASPTRRQFIADTETTSSDPVAVVTNEGDSWDDSDDDFDLEGDGWLKEVSASPPSIAADPDYEDYDDDDDDIIRQDAEEAGDGNPSDSEFLFLSPTDTRLLLEDDDDDPSSLIKVRHSSKTSFTDTQESNDNSIETDDKSGSDGQFVFTIDEGDDNNDDDSENKVDEENDDDFVLEDPALKTDNSGEKRQKIREDDDDDDDDDLEGEDNMFESPEDDAQVIYGDHVFLY